MKLTAEAARKYSRLDNLLRTGIPGVRNQPDVLAQLMRFGGKMTLPEAKRRLTYRESPLVVVCPLDSWGLFEDEAPDQFKLSQTLVERYQRNEEGQLVKTKFGPVPLIHIVTLHELVHLGDYAQNGNHRSVEAGGLFEMIAYGIPFANRTFGY